jgi:NAD(P)-dependent dehydrogenase (short-subunit alcohol dehydrogenase family)
MSNSSILHGKRAIVFGAGGSIGAAVAREFAAEGAHVFVASDRARMMTGTVVNAAAGAAAD